VIFEEIAAVPGGSISFQIVIPVAVEAPNRRVGVRSEPLWRRVAAVFTTHSLRDCSLSSDLFHHTIG